MKNVQRNLSLLLLCVVTFICLVSTASAAPGDLSSEYQQIVQRLPSQEAVSLSNEYNSRVAIHAGNEVPVLSPDWRTVQTFFMIPR